MVEHKGYYAIIPAEIRYDKELKANSKLLYGEITALCNDKGFCWASNDYFAELYGVSKETISRWISELNKKKYINVQINNKAKNNATRRIFINNTRFPASRGIDENVKGSCSKRQGGIDENVKYNNTVNNTNNKDIYKDIIDAFTENNSLSETISEFLKMRKLMKKQMTDRALKIMLNKLNDLGKSDNEKIKILEQSIMNNWQGIFALKDQEVKQIKQKEEKAKVQNIPPRTTVHYDDVMRELQEEEIREMMSIT